MKLGGRGPVRDQPAIPHASTFLPESKQAARRRVLRGEEAHGGLSGVTPTSWGLGCHSGRPLPQAPGPGRGWELPPCPPGLSSAWRRELFWKRMIPWAPLPAAHR